MKKLPLGIQTFSRSIQDWEQYPVLHIDFLNLRHETSEELIATLNHLTEQNADHFGIKLQQNGYNQVVGVAFDPALRNISEYKSEDIQY